MNLQNKLKQRGIESFLPNQNLPNDTVLQPPCGIKWMQIEHSFHMGSFSYGVSGYFCAVRIGRYCSFGENVQIGRQDHAKGWISTSPAFYLREKFFAVGDEFEGAEKFDAYSPREGLPPATKAAITNIGNDVWIGHGAYIKAGVSIGTGAIIAGHSVVVKDVPAYSIVAGNPAQIKKYRMPAELISPMLRSGWWKYAPWDLKAFDLANPREFLSGFMSNRENLQPYDPEPVRPNEL